MEKLITECEEMNASQQYLKNSNMNQFLLKRQNAKCVSTDNIEIKKKDSS
jgi:hypothetical protein